MPVDLLPDLPNKPGVAASQGAKSAPRDLLPDVPNKSLPEFDMPFEFSKRQAKTALGLMTTFDDKRELEIIKKNYPNLKFSEDADGNIVVDGTMYGGNVGYLNAPGLSFRDLTDVGFQVAAFSPAGRAASLAKSTLGKMTTVGTGSSVTQAGLDVGNQALGGTEEVSIGNIDKSDVAVAGIGGGVFEGLSVPLGKAFTRIGQRFRRSPTVTDEIRSVFKQAAKNEGFPEEQVTDDVIRRFLGANKEAGKRTAFGSANPDDVAATALKNEFGIRYSKGQQTGNAKQLELEDTLRNTQVSPGANKRMADLAEAQKDDINAAREKIRSSMGQADVTRPNQSGAIVRDSMRDAASALDDKIGQAYESVGDAYLSADGVKALAKKIKDSRRSIEWVRDPDLAPASNSLLKDADSLQKTLQKMGGNIKPFHIQRIEQMRRKINAFKESAKNPTDRRQVAKIKRMFDDYLDEAIDNALISGDETALDMLKKARGLRAEYGKRFQRRDVPLKSGGVAKDRVGDFIEKMIATNPTDEEVARALFGSGKFLGNRDSARIAGRVKQTLGKDSEAWQSIRQAAFLKIFKADANGNVSGRQALTVLKDAHQGRGESLMKALFTPQEIGQMYRFASAIKRAQPDRLNPSGSGDKIISAVGQLSNTLLTVLGFSQGGSVGAIGGKLAASGGDSMANFRRVMKAANAAKGVSKPFANLEALPAAGAAGAVSLGNRDQ